MHYIFLIFLKYISFAVFFFLFFSNFALCQNTLDIFLSRKQKFMFQDDQEVALLSATMFLLF